MDMFKEWKRGDCQKKLWNGAHQEKENEVDLNLPLNFKISIPNSAVENTSYKINMFHLKLI